MTTRPRAARLAVGLALATALLTGCGVRPNELALPFRAGTGSDATIITVRMPDVANLVPNSEVKVDDVTVGSVLAIGFEDWTAELTVGLEPGVALPANAVARLGQKSLLGAEFLELAPPAGEPAVGELSAGDTIPLDRTARYPETEEVLTALSVVLNGGGLQQVKTITIELNAALGGNEAEIRDLVANLSTFVGTLDRQKADIVGAIEGLDRLSGRLAEQDGTLRTALATVPDGLRVLEEQRGDLVEAFDALADLGDVGERVISAGKDDLRANLHNLEPALRRLADSGSNLTQSLFVLTTYPFPARTSFPSVFRGDMGNLFVTVDINPSDIVRNFGLGFPDQVPGLPLLALPPLGAGVEGGNPLELPTVPDLPVEPPPLPFRIEPDHEPGAAAPEAPVDDLLGLVGGAN